MTYHRVGLGFYMRHIGIQFVITTELEGYIKCHRMAEFAELYHAMSRILYII